MKPTEEQARVIRYSQPGSPIAGQAQRTESAGALMRFFHRHQWVSADAQPLLSAQFDRKTGSQVGPDTPITEVLQRCECRALRTITLDGHWTLEQINRGVPTYHG